MDNIEFVKPEYNQTFIKLLISDINTVYVYWNISDDYNKQFIDKYGHDFFEKTKGMLCIKCLRNNIENKIEIEDYSNDYYAKIKYFDSDYQAKLIRIGKEGNIVYDYELTSNIIHSPNIKILIDKYKKENVKFKNIKSNEVIFKSDYFGLDNYNINDIKQLYDELLIPSWNEYKGENGYKEN